VIRIELFGDEVERICILSPVTGEVEEVPESVKIYPAKHYVTDDETMEAAIIQIEAELEERVRRYAATIAGNAPLTVRAAKAAVDAFERYSDVEAAKEVAPMVYACFDSEDYEEGRRAFAEKREPEVKGR